MILVIDEVVSYMYTISIGKVAEQQDTFFKSSNNVWCVLGESHVTRSTADSADDWELSPIDELVRLNHA